MRTEGSAPVTVTRLSPPADFHSLIAHDVRAGLTAQEKSLPSKYFYDDRGSELFEQITALPEYYLTRVETEILQAQADHLMEQIQPDTIVEIGSGSSEKTRILIDAMERVAGGSTYMPIDISEAAVNGAALALCTDYPELRIDGMIGDFMKDLHLVPQHGRRLISFLGSTIGNFSADERISFLTEVRSMMGPEDRFLLGVDLVKSEDIVVPAYNDSAGVTAAFNRNILAVVNRNLSANFEPTAFEHEARWNPECHCIEAYLRATKPMNVTIEDLQLEIDLAEGEEIHSEVSCKFDRSDVEQVFAGSGMQLHQWLTDDRGWYALALAAPV